MIALLAAVAFLVGFGMDLLNADGEFLRLTTGGWVALGLMLLALHVGGMAWLDGRRQRGLR